MLYRIKQITVRFCLVAELIENKIKKYTLDSEFIGFDAEDRSFYLSPYCAEDSDVVSQSDYIAALKALLDQHQNLTLGKITFSKVDNWSRYN